MYVCAIILFIWACSAQSSNDSSRIANRGELPWHVLIYRKNSTPPYLLICGGSIVKPNVVISVAHCFWDNANEKIQPASNYAVAAGKVHRRWDDSDDNEYAQKSDVDSINIPHGYYDSVASYTNDLAVILLSKSFEYTQYIGQVNVDFEEIFDKLIGKVPTWRVDSQVLKVGILHTIPTDKCFAKVPITFRPFITNDKICGGPNNGTVLCVGDSGAGLVIPENDRPGSRYYLRGVASVSPRSDVDRCVSISAFTHLSKHERFLKKYLSRIPSNSTAPVPSDKCQLPEYPPNGRYHVHNVPNASPYQISDFWSVDIICDPGYGIVGGKNRRICTSGMWSPIGEFPKCIPCSAHSSNDSSCIANRGELPWHVLIYRKNSTPPYLLICGGSIVKPNVVISVAHCFWDYVNEKIQPASNYAVAAGKVHRSWDDSDDNEYAQKSDVDSINIPHGYYDSAASYTNDLAVILLSKSFEYNQYIGPVDVDFEEIFDKLIGKVPTWRVNSQVLKVGILHTIPTNKCFAKVPIAFRPFITNDKICGGPNNGTVLCQGDSGAGLVIPESDRPGSRYYLRGVASVSPRSDVDRCVSISAFTHLSKHERFLKKYLYFDRPQIPSSSTTQKPVRSDKCQLPEYPPNGRYQVYNAPNASPFQISDFWIVDITCDFGYGIVDSENRRFCTSGMWSPIGEFPKCIPFCKLNRHPSVQYRCRSSGIASLDTRACNDFEPPGTIAIPECVKPNYFSSGELSSIICNSEGMWSDNPRCLPACGEVTPEGVVLIRNGEYAKLGELPWHAGIYLKTSTPYRQICGGSIVRPSVVISAAHCFWDDKKPNDQKLQPPSNYAVAVGKLYRPWDDPEDNKYSQKTDVISINIPSKFHGVSANFMDDLAILLLAKSFEYKPHIAPVCLSFEDLFDRQQISKGVMAKVAGWGVTSPSGNPSPSLKVVDLPMVSYLDCYDASPPSFRRYITGDKICAGYKNNGTAVCEGDSGGGLVVAANDHGITRYYLRGIVSAAPDEVNHCIANEITTFTHVHYHNAFIKIYL